MNSPSMAPQPPFQGARGPKNGPNSHYRRARSPELDDYRLGDNDEALSPTSDIALQDAMIAQAQHQQRVVPIGQPSRNPAPRRRAPGGPPSPTKSQQPPSYPGIQLEDPPQPHPNAPRHGHYRRQTTGPPQRRPSGSEPPPGSGPPPRTGSPPRSNGNMPNRRPQSMVMDPSQRHPPSQGDPSTSGLSINRLNSPSITKTVLQPLEQKMQEYNHLMEEAHNQMLQLDEELRAMQERRREAEARFIEAKSKHDEYERQHSDVGRALRGEVERPITPRAIPRMQSVESFDQRPVSGQSSKMQKSRGRDRLRMSIFKSS